MEEQGQDEAESKGSPTKEPRRVAVIISTPNDITQEASTSEDLDAPSSSSSKACTFIVNCQVGGRETSFVYKPAVQDQISQLLAKSLSSSSPKKVKLHSSEDENKVIQGNSSEQFKEPVAEGIAIQHSSKIPPRTRMQTRSRTSAVNVTSKNQEAVSDKEGDALDDSKQKKSLSTQKEKVESTDTTLSKLDAENMSKSDSDIAIEDANATSSTNVKTHPASSSSSSVPQTNSSLKRKLDNSTEKSAPAEKSVKFAESESGSSYRYHDGKVREIEEIVKYVVSSEHKDRYVVLQPVENQSETYAILLEQNLAEPATGLVDMSMCDPSTIAYEPLILKRVVEILSLHPEQDGDQSDKLYLIPLHKLRGLYGWDLQNTTGVENPISLEKLSALLCGSEAKANWGHFKKKLGEDLVLQPLSVEQLEDAFFASCEHQGFRFFQSKFSRAAAQQKDGQHKSSFVLTLFGKGSILSVWKDFTPKGKKGSRGRRSKYDYFGDDDDYNKFKMPMKLATKESSSGTPLKHGIVIKGSQPRRKSSDVPLIQIKLENTDAQEEDKVSCDLSSESQHITKVIELKSSTNVEGKKENAKENNSASQETNPVKSVTKETNVSAETPSDSSSTSGFDKSKDSENITETIEVEIQDKEGLTSKIQQYKVVQNPTRKENKGDTEDFDITLVPVDGGGEDVPCIVLTNKDVGKGNTDSTSDLPEEDKSTVLRAIEKLKPHIEKAESTANSVTSLSSDAEMPGQSLDLLEKRSHYLSTDKKIQQLADSEFNNRHVILFLMPNYQDVFALLREVPLNTNESDAAEKIISYETSIGYEPVTLIKVLQLLKVVSVSSGLEVSGTLYLIPLHTLTALYGWDLGNQTKVECPLTVDTLSGLLEQSGEDRLVLHSLTLQQLRQAFINSLHSDSEHITRVSSTGMISDSEPSGNEITTDSEFRLIVFGKGTLHSVMRELNSQRAVKQELLKSGQSRRRIKPPLLCKACDMHFRTMPAYVLHCNEFHDARARIESRRFKSEKELMQWREEIERATHERFLVSRKKYRLYLHCCRSGDYTPQYKGNERKKRMKKLGSMKCGVHCTAFIHGKGPFYEGDEIVATYCLEHFGHTSDVRHNPLSIEIKEKIRQKILEGYTVSQILLIIQSENPSRIRDQMLKTGDIRNIAASMGIKLPKSKQRVRKEKVNVMYERKQPADQISIPGGGSYKINKRKQPADQISIPGGGSYKIIGEVELSKGASGEVEIYDSGPRSHTDNLIANLKARVWGGEVSIQDNVMYHPDIGENISIEATNDNSNEIGSMQALTSYDAFTPSLQTSPEPKSSASSSKMVTLGSESPENVRASLKQKCVQLLDLIENSEASEVNLEETVQVLDSRISMLAKWANK